MHENETLAARHRCASAPWLCRRAGHASGSGDHTPRRQKDRSRRHRWHRGAADQGRRSSGAEAGAIQWRQKSLLEILRRARQGEESDAGREFGDVRRVVYESGLWLFGSAPRGRKEADLDKPAYEYRPKPLPEYPAYADLAGDARYKKITSRMLLSHTPGFADWRWFEDVLKLKIHFERAERASVFVVSFARIEARLPDHARRWHRTDETRAKARAQPSLSSRKLFRYSVSRTSRAPQNLEPPPPCQFRFAPST